VRNRTLNLVLASLFIMLTMPAASPKNLDSLLSKKEISIISIAALTAKGDLTRLKKELETGLESGLTINQIKEVQVHLYAYCGFPRSIRGLQTFMQVLEERKAKGIKDVMGVDASPINESKSKYERGRSTLSKLTNSQQERPISGYGALAPIMDTFLKEHLFADIFDRDILTYSERELTTIAVLTAIGGADPMLKSHYSICLNLGIGKSKLYEFTEVIRSLLGDDVSMKAKINLDEVLKK
jgi:4-carboxymuconolactone decarboxylase